MVIKRTYGKIRYRKSKSHFEISEVEPHICIKLKEIFKRIGTTDFLPYFLPLNADICHDLWWFMQRYPLVLSTADNKIISDGRNEHIEMINRMEKVFLPSHRITDVALNEGKTARHYQLIGKDVVLLAKRILIGDDVGLGKSLTSLLPLVHAPKDKLPAAVVVQSHLSKQWQVDQIEKFTNLRVHIIKTVKNYDLPPADIYIFTYSKLGGWVDVFATSFFHYAIFDEVQELRHRDTGNYKSIKYSAAKVLSNHVEYVVGLSATPIYNYANEIFNVLDLIKPGCLGDCSGFEREWTRNGKVVKDPKALGTFLRENFLMLRRTRAEVGRELPELNRLVYTVGYDHNAADEAQDIAQQLAIRVFKGTFTERGEAARELDIFMRRITGVSKAKEVAAFVKILLDNGEPVILAGWHRDVYKIWLKELAEYKPAMYTGSESSRQKDVNKAAFINGETNLMIMSLRSGAGIDGLQNRCHYAVVGELDYSPQVHSQFFGRLRRDSDAEAQQVTAIFTVSEYGSDPVIVDLLGLKSSQSEGLLNPLQASPARYSDESRIQLMAKAFLKDKKILSELSE